MAHTWVSLCLVITTLLIADAVQSDESLRDAIVNGKFSLNLRYRFEHVDDDFRPGGMSLKDANASTLRTTIGYKSGTIYGFSTLLEMEQVSRVFGGEFNEGVGGSSRYAAVVDPDGTELNQGYLQYQAPHANKLKLGRQIITYRQAPFHRFIGTILWRQNWQTFDAVSLKNTYLPDTTISYAYIWNVHRIFGDSAPEPLSHFNSDSHLINIQNNRFSFARLEAYAYLLDFDNAPVFSSQTYGIRLHGDYPLNDIITPIYALEYAGQSDYGRNTASYDADYHLLEAGMKLKPSHFIDNLVFKISYERLEGNGLAGNAFNTILGTNHAFQGTADRFLVTPIDGIQNYYVTGVMSFFDFKYVISYHVLESDNLDYRYGTELDIELSRDFGEHISVGLKYSDYNADRNPTNVLKNGAIATDASKIWFYAILKF